jgi:hypothetical protein
MRKPDAKSILVVAGALFAIYAYPGVMVQDSIDQLNEARAGFYTDAHPPAMAALWRIVDAIVAGPFGMVVIQGTAFLAGGYLVLRRALQPRAAAIAASAVLLYPPVLTTMGVVWKDALTAGLLLLGAGLLLEGDRRRRIAGLVALGLASAMRYNAFAATLPLVVLLFEWTPTTRLKRYALAVGAWLGITVAAMGANTLLVDQPMHFWHSSLAVFDIVGTIDHEGELSDDDLRRELADTGLLVDRDIQARARAIYATKEAVKIVFGPDRMWDLPIAGQTPAPEAQRDAIASAWWRLVTEHPGAYLRHRLACFGDVLGLTYKTYTAIQARTVKYPGMLTNLGLGTGWSEAQTKWSRVLRWIWDHTPLFRQWVYIVVALVLLWPARRERDVLALLASGLVIEASLFFLAPSPDYRYSHWAITCACLAVVMLTARRAAAVKDT